MGTQDVFEYLRRLRDRISGVKYKPPRLEDLKLAEPVRVPDWDKLMDTTAIHKELDETRAEATSILEGLVRQSESERRRLETIFDNLNEAVMLCSKTGKIETTNRTMRQVLGLKSSEILGKSLTELFPMVLNYSALEIESFKYLDFVGCDGCGEKCLSCQNSLDHDALALRYAEYVRTKSTFLNRHLHATHERPDGALVSIWLSINVLLSTPFLPEFSYIVVVRDITEQKRVESEVANLRTVNAGLQWAAQTPVFYKDADLNLTSINRPFRELLSVSDSVIGQPIGSVFDADSAERLEKLDRVAMDSERAKFAHMTLTTVQGDVHNAVVFSRAVRANGEVVSITGALVNNAELDAHARSEIFALVSKAIVFLDHDMRVTGCNDEFVRLVGIEKDRLIGQDNTMAELEPFLRHELTGVLADTIEHNGRHINRMSVPVSSISSVQQDGMVYIFFVQFDK